MYKFQEMLFLFSSTIKNRRFIKQNLLEASLLYDYVVKCDSNVVEIGSRYGGSAVLISSALTEGKKVYTIDIKDYKEPRKFLLKASPPELIKKIEFIKGDSSQVAQKWEKSKKIGLIFIDGDHRVSGLAKDIKNWSPVLTSGGYIVFHDILTHKINKKPWRQKPVISIHKGEKGLLELIKKDLISKGWKRIDSAQSLLVIKKP